VLDVSGLPPLPLRSPAEGTQSRVIHTRQPLIMNDLQKQLGKPGSTAVKVGTDKKYTQSALYVPMLAKGRVAGVMQVQSYAPGRYTPSDADLLSFIGNTAAIAILNAQLVEQMQHYDRELEQACDSALESWSRTLDLRDKETEDHTRRVTALTVRLARAMGMCERDIVHVRRGARLHDIGKVGIPDSILHKPGPLTAEEWQVMKQHPTLAYELLAPLEQMRPALDIPYCHHEKWDGTGYPRGLKGEEIPLAARIFAVVDVWDALCSDRPYRKALPPDQALALIRAEAGTHFDPTVVHTFLSALNE
ncbi:MAG: HD domain-containing protein, partial [Chloroflexi bacterium]|nr:HD domain-containing protein [Chloroflexota bacterium]